MEVATYAPYRRNTFAPEYNPHYAQYQVTRGHPAMAAAQYQSATQQAPRQTQASSSSATAAAAAATSQAVDDANKPSLPSISNLLGIADGDRVSQQETCSPSQAQAQQTFYTSAPPDHAFNQTYVTVAEPVQTVRGGPLVPTPPPVRSDSVVDAAHSPNSLAAANQYYLEAASQQQQRSMAAMKRHSVPMPNGTAAAAIYNSASPYPLQQHAATYTSSPSTISQSSYYSPPEPLSQIYTLYQQRPLPSNFPPTALLPHQTPLMTSSPGAAAPNPWEHHHYIAPSAQSAAYQQPQDRYVCQTCNKAFSRPSSLKIHSYSHTGEKPFKCPQPNCGKAFSVRSNMKRHERGCHGGASNIMT